VYVFCELPAQLMPPKCARIELYILPLAWENDVRTRAAIFRRETQALVASWLRNTIKRHEKLYSCKFVLRREHLRSRDNQGKWRKMDWLGQNPIPGLAFGATQTQGTHVDPLILRSWLEPCAKESNVRIECLL
jgi:hypothetical protein